MALVGWIGCDTLISLICISEAGLEVKHDVLFLIHQCLQEPHVYAAKVIFWATAPSVGWRGESSLNFLWHDLNEAATCVLMPTDLNTSHCDPYKDNKWVFISVFYTENWDTYWISGRRFSLGEWVWQNKTHFKKRVQYGFRHTNLIKFIQATGM